MKETFVISKRCRERFFNQTAEGVRAISWQEMSGGGLSDLRSPYEITRMGSPAHVMLFTLAGEGRLQSPVPVRKLVPGTVCILPAGGDHVYGTSGRWKLLWFHSAPTASWTELMPAKPQLFKPKWTAQLHKLAEEFLQESSRREQAEHHQLLEGYARQMALLLRRELHGFKPSGETEHRQKLERLWQRVSERPADPWKVETLAVASHLSRSHLQAVVQRLYACGVMEMVMRLRMERATDLLLQRGAKLAEIAERVGYDSPFSFSRAFKRIFGVSPEVYRRRRGNSE